jgi:acyl-coenzyme A thioesterase PaaI-like protein
MANRLVRGMSPRRLRRLFNLWPPYLFAGIRIVHIADDWREAEVELRLRWYNRNYVGVHFGGSLFAMTDPFWMLLVMNALGREYVVWDREGAIEFVKPGRGTVRAVFRLDEPRLEEIRGATADGEKYRPWFETEIVDADGDVVARVRKRLHVRRKQDKVEIPETAGRKDAGSRLEAMSPSRSG